tara:strand:- start:243 stop:1688 length:1446 start_codon:yes stop_codon:yes gene_type:complete
MKIHYALLVGIISISLLIPAFGHGTGIESSPYVKVGDRDIRVTVEQLALDNISAKKFFQIYAYDRTNKTTIENINFDIEIFKEDQLLLSDSYFEQEGLLVVELDIDESGIFTFNTKINSEDEFGIIDNLEFENQISVTEITNHIQTIEQIPVEFRVKSYYDSIARFVYNQTDQTAKIIIPFDWKEQNISHTSVVHTEIMFPKDFVSFLAPNYFGTANGIELFKSSIFIDDYSEEESRIVHFVLLKDQLRYIKTQMTNIDTELPDTLELILRQGDEIKFPVIAFTLSEEYQVDLSWDPKEIRPGVETKFIYTFRDTSDLAPIRDSDYTLTLLQNNKEIFSRSAHAKIGADFTDYTFSEQETGVTVARFSNISGSGQETEFAFIVLEEEKSNVVSIPAWIKDHAKWWAEGVFDDNTYADGIEYMINVGIIVIPVTQSGVENQDAIIPEWVKNTAGWWANDEIPDSAYVNAIQYLIKEGIITVT